MVMSSADGSLCPRGPSPFQATSTPLSAHRDIWWLSGASDINESTLTPPLTSENSTLFKRVIVRLKLCSGR